MEEVKRILDESFPSFKYRNVSKNFKVGPDMLWLSRHPKRLLLMRNTRHTKLAFDFEGFPQADVMVLQREDKLAFNASHTNLALLPARLSEMLNGQIRKCSGCQRETDGTHNLACCQSCMAVHCQACWMRAMLQGSEICSACHKPLITEGSRFS